MLRTRFPVLRVLGLATVLGLVSGALVVTVTPAQADTRWAYVYGYVRDQLGQPRDGVVVELQQVGAPSAVRATQLTYEGEDGDHGFYNLSFQFDTSLTHEFRLRFSSAPGAEDPFRTQTLQSTVVVDKENDFVFVDDVTMQLARKVRTTTKLAAVRPTVHDRQTQVARVTVVAPELKRLDGRVEVVISREAGRRSKTALDKRYSLKTVRKKVGTSAVELTVPKLASPGAPKCEKKKRNGDCKQYDDAKSHVWDVAVTFLGSSLAKKSGATMTIASWAKGHQPVSRSLPNALL